RILPDVGADPEYPEVSPRDAKALREWKAMGVDVGRVEAPAAPRQVAARPAAPVIEQTLPVIEAAPPVQPAAPADHAREAIVATPPQAAKQIAEKGAKATKVTEKRARKTAKKSRPA